MDEQEAQATAVAGAEEASIPRLAERLRRARRWYAAAAVVLAAGGLGATAAGLLGVGSARVPATALVAVGLLAAALAALPWREALDRRDRAGGLEVLAEE